MKLYFAEIFYSQHGAHCGAFYLTKYDAAAYIIGFLSGGMEEEDLPTEDGILAMKNKCGIYHGSSIPVIASGEIDRVDFSILELEPGQSIDLNI